MIAVVMGCESSKARIKDARTLLDYGFSNCQRIHSETTRKEIGRIPVQKGQRSEVSCQEKVTADLIDIKTQKGKIVKKIKIDSVKAPVKKGQKMEATKQDERYTLTLPYENGKLEITAIDVPGLR